jgi:hypothetical protein
MSRYDAAYFEDLQGRLRALLISIADQLSPQTIRLADEMIDAAECGIALDMLSEMLVESGARIDKQILADIAGLVDTMGLEAETVNRLRPLLTAN